jgi:hypothetical protein
MPSKLLIAGFALVLGTASPYAQTAAQPATSAPQQVWTWDQVKERFELDNTTLLASKLNIDELKAQEITAHLRPNPGFTLTADGTQITANHGVWQPFAGTFISPGVSYLFERRNKRGLRYEAARKNAAHGASRGWQVGNEQAPEGRKNRSHAHTSSRAVIAAPLSAA